MRLQKLPTILTLLISTPPSALSASRHLWYKTPAPPTDWEQGALPVGNGRLGATIYGGISNEVVTINENSIWSGPLQERTPENALAALPVSRGLLLDGNITQAGGFIPREMNHPVDSMRAYSYFGNLEVGVGHGGGDGDGFPAGILAARFTASKKGALSLNATFSRAADVTSLRASASGNTPLIELSGSSGQPAEENPILYTGQARFKAKWATTIELFFDAETNHRYPGQDKINTEIDRKLTSALRKGFEKIKDEASKDSSGLLDRASINLGKSSDEIRKLPTDERITRARSGLDDPELATLAWNYGRHMLVASSRNTKEDLDLRANVQGIWNNKTTAAWGGKYTININTEMNYWPAGQTNIIETQEPLFDLFKVAHPRAQALARDMYNCSRIFIYHNLNL
ncbi:glycosyl hydrolase family 65, N-terminal domain-containing protein [Aspergillus crustosus]